MSQPHASLRVLGALLFCAFSVPLLAQQSPFFPEKTYDALANEISGDIAFDISHEYRHTHA